MTITFELGIRNLLTDFLANALIIFAALQPAGTVTTGTLQSFFDRLNHFLVFIQSDSHIHTSLLNHYSSMLQKVKFHIL